MKRETWNLLTRFLAGVGASLILVGVLAQLPQKNPRDNVYTRASNIRSDAALLTVDGEKVTAEEYLYYVAQSGLNYHYMLSYSGAGDSVDWDMPLDETGTVTLRDSVLAQARQAVVQNAVIRRMAKDADITPTQTELDRFRQQLDQLRAQYGDDFRQVLKQYGLTETLWETLYTTSCLALHLQEAYVSGALRPDDAALTELVADHGLAMARSLFVSTAYMDETGIAKAKADAQGYQKRILAAEDPAAELAAINTELGVAEAENTASVYHCGHEGETDAVCLALKDLQVGELSALVETDEGFYLLLRQEMDMDTVAKVQFSEDLEEAMAAAQVRESKNMARVDVGAFVESMMAELSAQD